jgi:hypothetical protein
LGGLDGVGDLGLEECQGSCRGYGVSTVYHCRLVLVYNIFLPSSAILSLCLLLTEGSLRSTTPVFVNHTINKQPTRCPCVILQVIKLVMSSSET